MTSSDRCVSGPGMMNYGWYRGRSRVGGLRVGVALCGAALLVLLAACGSSSGGSGSSGVSGATAGGKSAPLTVVWNSTPDVTYLPMLMAVDALKKQGYNIKAQTVSGADVAAQALASDRAQFTFDSISGAAAAIAHGAGIKIVAAESANPAVWVTAEGYQDCNKLAGKNVGVFGPAAASGYTKEMDLYFEKHCPNVQPHLVTIPDSSLRAQAMANHQIVATVLVLSDADTLTKKLDTKDHFTITKMSEEFPGVADNYLYASTKVLQSDPGAVDALVAATLTATRQVYADAAKPAALSALLHEFMPAKSYTTASAQSALDAKIWYANGGLDAQGISGLTETLKLFQLPGTADNLIDGSLTSALGKIGASSDTTR